MDKVTVLRGLGNFGPRGYVRVGKYVNRDGAREPFPVPRHWELHEHQIANLEELFQLLCEVTPAKHSILIRGEFKGGDHLNCRRTRMNFRSSPKRWIMIDFDDLLAPHGVKPDSQEAVAFAINQLPPEFHDADAIAHFSSSAGMAGKKIKLHLFFWLEEPQEDDTLRRWAKGLGGLIDHSVFNCVQPHYVCDPEFEDSELDPFKDRSRLFLIRKNRRAVPVSFLSDFRTPKPSKKYKEGMGVLKGNRNRPAGPTSPDGKLIDGREECCRDCRFKRMNQGYEDFNLFVADVFEDFRSGAELGPTERSETNWDFELVRKKCEQDRHKLPLYVGSKIKRVYDYLSREEAQVRLKATVEGFVNEPYNLLVRAEAGLGKSSAVQAILAHHPDTLEKNIEVYTPTKKLAHEWADALRQENSELDVRVIEGRSNETCHKFDLARDVAKLGGGVTHHLCHNERTGQSCEFWGKCRWSTQNPNDGPAVRIFTHSHLNLDRPNNAPEPDFIVVDEGILGEQVATEEIDIDDLTSRRGCKLSLGNQKFYGPELAGGNDTLITLEDLETALRVGGKIADALSDESPLLDHLRRCEVSSIRLERCGRAIGAFTPFPFITPGDSNNRQRASLRQAKTQEISVLRKLKQLFGTLAEEMRTDRADSRTITLENGKVVLRYRRDLNRLDGIPTMFLDADGEISLLRKSMPDITEEHFPVRYNAKIWQATDRSFSKSSLGLGAYTDVDNDHAEILRFLEALPMPSKTLVVTYKGLQDILTNTGDGFSQMPNGAIVGHFGNIRGTDDYKDFDTIVVIGRNRPPAHVIGLTADALAFDSADDISSELKSAVYRSKITSETNQAVARLRLVWNDKPKTVYLLSDEEVPFPVDYRATWSQLAEGKNRLHDLYQGYDVVPLDSGWLNDHAPALFDTKKAAERWIEEYYPTGTEDGTFRLEGARGRHKRFLMTADALSPINSLTALFGALSAYDGPPSGIWMDGRIWRHAYNNPRLKKAYEMGIFWQSGLPKPGT